MRCYGSCNIICSVLRTSHPVISRKKELHYVMQTLKHIFFVVLLAVSFVAKSQTVENDVKALNAIKYYLEYKFENVKPKGKNIATFKVLDTKLTKNKIFFFIWAYIMDYKVHGNKLVKCSGSSLPVRLTLSYSDSNYNVIKGESPTDGNNYRSGLKKIFSTKAYKIVKLGLPNNILKKIEEESESEAKSYYRIN